MRMRIQVTKMMRIRIHNTVTKLHCLLTDGGERGRVEPRAAGGVVCKLMRIRIRFRIRLITLMQIWIRIFIWGGCGSRLPKWCGSGSFQIKAQTLKKVLKKAHIFHTFWPVDLSDPVPDPAYHFDTDPDTDFYLMRMWLPKWSGSGSTTLPQSYYIC